MKFDDLYNLMLESGFRPGAAKNRGLYSRAMDSEGPSGVTSSPIGRSDYNPEEYVPDNKDPKDKGMSDAASVIKILGKSFQLLKNDEVFQDQMRGIMNGFKKNRQQINAYQENIIKYKPKVIDNLWGRINRLIKIVNDPKKRLDSDITDFEEELEDLKKQKDEEQAELDKVFKEIENVAGENEDINDSYLAQMLAIVQDTSKRLYKQLSNEIQIDKENKKPEILALHELDYDKLEKEIVKNYEVQLYLLESLFTDNEKSPLRLFLNIQEERYKNAKINFFQTDRGDNYSIAAEQLYRNLPLFSLVNYFSHVILKSPPIKLNTKQAKKVKKVGSGDGMVKRLENVKTEKQFEDLRPDLINYIKSLKIDKFKKDTMVNIANQPFAPIRGRATSAVKLIAMLKADNITESFDDFFEQILSEFSYDEDDYKLDMMEIVESKSKKCTGPTKKASSDRKGKKWTKCAKQPDGSYKRIHWGEAGVRVGSGDSKRKKSFKARHKCSSAKPGSPKAQACKDWK